MSEAKSDLDGVNDDLAAMDRLAKGEDSALSEIMVRWRRPIWAFLYRVVNDYETAADLAQEVFVKLYQSRGRYRPGKPGSFSSYLFTIAANTARNHLRWRKRHPEAELGERETREFAKRGEVQDPSQVIEQHERSEEVRSAVQRLPEKLRTPLVLFHFQELPQAEIARILQCSVKTVETRLYRARKLVRKDLLE